MSLTLFKGFDISAILLREGRTQFAPTDNLFKE
jgi:hypothetical protein